MHAQLSEDPLNALEEGATVVTANRRLARHWRARYGMVQQGRGLEAWPTPDILPWQAWVQRLWESAADPFAPELARGPWDDQPPTLLTAWQEQALWERIVAESEPENPLLNVPAAAQTACEAWRLWREWRLPLKDACTAQSLDTRTFLSWAQAFDRHCTEHRLLEGARLPDRIASCIKAGCLPTPARILLMGFDELTPQQKDLLEVLRALGTAVETVGPPSERGRVRRIPLADANSEIETAARWARTRVKADPTARIGIVVQDLAAKRAAVLRIFDDVLHPEAALPGQTRSGRAYNLSLGQPLSREPVVFAALEILSLCERTIPLTRIGSLLRSPFLGGAEAELTHRACLDVRLREHSGPEIGLRTVRWMASASDENKASRPFSCPLLVRQLQAFCKVKKGLPARQSHSAWAQSFTELLACLGWPGERTLSSEEHQAVRAWRDALRALASRDRIETTVDRGRALARLRRIMAETVFQPESPEAPIQVLGVLEAAGARFDHLWILGLHDGVWPAAAQPNPFLPIHLQRRHNLPHSSAGRELEVARTVTNRLLASAPDVVVSHPQREGDRDLHPSPLIAGLDEITVGALDAPAVEDYRHTILGSATLEFLIDDMGPALEAGASIGGGARLLADQAACPFRAFAAHRLGAHSLKEPTVGLQAADRGSLVHAALEKVWGELRTHAQLCSCTSEALREIVQDAARQAIEEFGWRRDLGARFYAIEQARLETLLLSWLETVEKRRAPFEVMQLEQRQHLTVGGLTLTTRADRVDRLSDSGEAVFIDYKTGHGKAPDWFDDRFEEPQLPLYSVCGSDGSRPAAVLLAFVRQDKPEYRGIASRGGLVPGIDQFAGVEDRCATWNAVFEAWGQVLESLADEIRQGRARIDPRKPPETCKYCELPTLCRLQEVFAQTSVADAEEDSQ